MLILKSQRFVDLSELKKVKNITDYCSGKTCLKLGDHSLAVITVETMTFIFQKVQQMFLLKCMLHTKSNLKEESLLLISQ